MRLFVTALAVFLACALPSSAAVTPKSPQALTAKIRHVLAARHAPMASVSAQFVAQGCGQGVDPRLLLGISLAETEGGKTGTGRPEQGYGALGVGPKRVYPSYKAALADAARILGRYYVHQGLLSVAAIERKWVGYASADWLRSVTWAVKSLGGNVADVRAKCANAPTRQPPPLPPVKKHGPRIDKNCAHRLLTFNTRGKCIRQLQWLLTGQDPAARPTKKSVQAVNRDGRYWHMRSIVTGVYGKATVKQVQTVKDHLGYPNEHANGAAGPRLRKYLLGETRLPKSYAAAEANRYQAWKARQGAGSRMKTLLADANYLLAANSRFHYTQTMTGPNGRLSLLLYHPRGPPAPGEIYGDCSGTTEALLWWSFGIDAAGAGAWQHYPSSAVYTGTQSQHGKLVWRAGQSLTRLRPGDFVFYGPSPTFSHVTMVMTRDGQRVFSMGSEGCPCLNATLYRSDAVLARRYIG